MATSEEKRWAKEARLRRQALKKAAMPSTNLFQARIRRTELNNRPRSRPWIWILFLLIGAAAGVAWWMQNSPLVHDKMIPAVVSAPTPSLADQLQASSAPVVAPVAVSVPSVVAQSVAASSADVHVILPDTREWHGSSSDIHDLRHVIIKGRKNWRDLWKEMGRTDEAPHINFYEHEVVGLFLGARATAGYEVQIDSAQDRGETVAVTYRVLEPLPNAPLVPEKTYPFQLRVIDRTDRPVHFIPVSPSTANTSH